MKQSKILTALDLSSLDIQNMLMNGQTMPEIAKKYKITYISLVQAFKIQKKDFKYIDYIQPKEEVKEKIKHIMNIEIKQQVDINKLSTQQKLELVTQHLLDFKKEVQPKVDFYDTVTKSDEWMEMSEVAKLLNYQKLGRNKIFNILRENKILRKNNQPYQEYVDRGCFKLIEQVYTTTYGDTRISYKTVISQKGLDYIKKIIDNIL
jgi:phage antirepressor YoqD-like protein